MGNEIFFGFKRMKNFHYSESSLFVAQRKVILKTCGTTTLLKCLKTLIHLVYQMTGFDYVENVFYSHKNFNRPDLQSSPHQHFEHEVELLDSFFSDRGKIFHTLQNGVDDDGSSIDYLNIKIFRWFCILFRCRQQILLVPVHIESVASGRDKKSSEIRTGSNIGNSHDKFGCKSKERHL